MRCLWQMPQSSWRSQSAQWWGRVSSASALPRETPSPPSSSTCPTWTSPSTKPTAGTTSTRTQTDTPPRAWSSCGRKESGWTTAARPSTSTAASTTRTEERAYFWSCSRRVSRNHNKTLLSNVRKSEEKSKLTYSSCKDVSHVGMIGSLVDRESCLSRCNAPARGRRNCVHLFNKALIFDVVHHCFQKSTWWQL